MLCVCAVSASENATEISVSDDVNQITDADEEQIISADEDAQEILGNETGTGFEEDEGDNYQNSEAVLYEHGVLSAKPLTTTYKIGNTFNVKVVSGYNQSFALKNIKLKLAVKTGTTYKYYYASTDSNGIAKFSTSKISIGKHAVIISSIDEQAFAYDINSTITIKKAKPIVIAPTTKNKFAKSAKFKIKVKDKTTKKPMKRVKLKVNIYTDKKVKVYKLKTNSKGIAKINTKKLSIGKHKVIIKSGSKKYKFTKKTKIIIC